MKKAIIATFVTTIFFTSTISANWVIINDDGTTEPLNCKCSIKRTVPPKVIKKWKPAKKSACAPSRPCNTESLPSAQLFPVSSNENLQPAVLKNCQYE